MLNKGFYITPKPVEGYRYNFIMLSFLTFSVTTFLLNVVPDVYALLLGLVVSVISSGFFEQKVQGATLFVM